MPSDIPNRRSACLDLQVDTSQKSIRKVESRWNQGTAGCSLTRRNGDFPLLYCMFGVIIQLPFHLSPRSRNGVTMLLSGPKEDLIKRGDGCDDPWRAGRKVLEGEVDVRKSVLGTKHSGWKARPPECSLGKS